MERNYAKLTVTPKAERALRQGHPWVYGEEVVSSEGGWAEGDIVDVLSPKGRWLGAGFVNGHSKIRVRVVSRNTNDRFDEAFSAAGSATPCNTAGRSWAATSPPAV